MESQSDATPAVLTADGLLFAWSEGKPLLEDVSLSLRAGELLAVVGPNGCGKTTLLSLLLGYRKAQRGTVRLDGRNVSSLSPKEIARQMAALPQSEVAAPALTAREMVRLGRTAHWRGLLGMAGPQDEEIVSASLARCGMAGFAERRIGMLSGGERQLVLVARALAQQPRVLLLDEPSSALDLGHQQELFRLLRRLVEEDGLSVLAVTHDLNLAALYADRVAILWQGRIQAMGAPVEVLTAERLRSVYGAQLDVCTSPDGRPMVMLER